MYKKLFFIILFLLSDLSFCQNLRLIEKLNTIKYPKPPSINGKSAILISENDGSILYQKNSNQVIPPASLTKLVVLYTAMEYINKNHISFDTEVEIPKYAYYKNLPKDSSFMFLGPDQKVTLKDLFLGLSVSSGNDAAYALAGFVSGSVDKFVSQMNKEVKKLGLKNTSFVEPSGYDSKNVTTAREFAFFCYNYIKKYPQNLKNFHSVKSFTYPRPENLVYTNSSNNIKQNNRNGLLWKYEGIVDGLKTGYIDESGYNIAVTGKVEDKRLIAVVLGNYPKDNKTGSQLREQDVASLLDYGFNNFTPTSLNISSKFAKISSNIWLSDKKILSFKPIRDIKITLPKDITDLYYKVVYKKDVLAPITTSDIIGYIVVLNGDSIIFKIPIYPKFSVEKKKGISLFFSLVELFFYKKFILKGDIEKDFSLPLS